MKEYLRKEFVMKQKLLKKVLIYVLPAAMAVGAFTACDKDEIDPCAPLKNKVATHEADSVRLVKENRQHIKSIAPQLNDITDYWSVFNGPKANFEDSTKKHIYVIEFLYSVHGNPLPVYATEIDKLYSLSKGYFENKELLTIARNEYNNCQGK